MSFTKENKHASWCCYLIESEPFEVDGVEKFPEDTLVEVVNVSEVFSDAALRQRVTLLRQVQRNSLGIPSFQETLPQEINDKCSKRARDELHWSAED